LVFIGISRQNYGDSGDLNAYLKPGIPTSTAADFVLLEASLIDEDTYVERGLMWNNTHWRYLEYIFQTLVSSLIY
jgi:hypothetical protein